MGSSLNSSTSGAASGRTAAAGLSAPGVRHEEERPSPPARLQARNYAIEFSIVFVILFTMLYAIVCYPMPSSSPCASASRTRRRIAPGPRSPIRRPGRTGRPLGLETLTRARVPSPAHDRQRRRRGQALPDQGERTKPDCESPTCGAVWEARCRGGRDHHGLAASLAASAAAPFAVPDTIVGQASMLLDGRTP